MPDLKYQTTRPVDLEADGCDLDTWRGSPNGALFARHGRGFPIFLAPDEIESCDEYSDDDPYAVEGNQSADFQRRRVECTVELCRHLREALRVLDLGCGRGHITAELQKLFPGAEIAGLDYSVSAIAYAVEHFPGIEFAAGNAYRCPYPPECFDLVVCNNLWEHVPDPLQLLREISRVLKPGGHVVMSTPSRYRFGNLVRVLAGRPVGFMSERHVTEYTVGQVKEQFRFGGYDVVRAYSRPEAGSRWMVRAAKRAISAGLALAGSHHQLEGTVFYLARRRG